MKHSADINGWSQFLYHHWNGIALNQSDPVTSYSLKLFTDASSIGFGAVYDRQWFMLSQPILPITISTFLELFSIVASVFTWGLNGILFIQTVNLLQTFVGLVLNQ